MAVDFVRSDDGTRIAFEVAGSGPLLIVVNGALSTRGAGVELSALLEPHFRVLRYDRRGRGDSSDAGEYSTQREVDDIEELIDANGGSAFLYGHSSGGCLALEAAALLGSPEVMRVCVYEAPWGDDPAVQPGWTACVASVRAALREGRRGDAVALFLEYIGIPATQVAGMRQAPMWADFEVLAHTVAYDCAVVGESRALPRRQLAFVNASVLALAGGASAAMMAQTARTISEQVTTAEFAVLDGQAHNVSAALLAPLLIRFFETD